MLTISILTTFQAVARLGSMNAAAVELHCAPSTVSSHVKQFNAYIGHPLFERTPDGYVLTEHGRHVHQAATIALAQLDTIQGLRRRSPIPRKRQLGIRAVPQDGPLAPLVTA